MARQGAALIDKLFDTIRGARGKALAFVAPRYRANPLSASRLSPPLARGLRGRILAVGYQMDSPSRDESSNACCMKVRYFSLSVYDDYFVLLLLLPSNLEKCQSITASNQGSQARESAFSYLK
jgi:hypothetical protein